MLYLELSLSLCQDLFADVKRLPVILLKGNHCGIVDRIHDVFHGLYFLRIIHLDQYRLKLQVHILADDALTDPVAENIHDIIQLFLVIFHKDCESAVRQIEKLHGTDFCFQFLDRLLEQHLSKFKTNRFAQRLEIRNIDN